MISFFIVLPLALATLLMAAYCGHGLRLRKHQSKQRTGVAWLKLMRQFLANLQQHRGRCHGFINGDTSLRSEIEHLQQHCDDLIEKIESLDDWIGQSSRWQGIVDHWQRLKTGFKKIEPENNLKQHFFLIQNLLYLFEDMADEHHLNDLRGQNNKRISYVWKELLEIIEHLGQARAVGTGVAAAGRCTSVNRIKLNYLTQKMTSNQLRLQDFVSQDSHVNDGINELISCIQQHLLGEHCQISSQEYFQKATKYINLLYEQFDQRVNQLAR